jgi:predicted RNA-binding protein with PUA-like domain
VAAKKASDNYATGPWAATFAPRSKGERRFWLIKSEPEVFSFADLQKAPGKTTHWNSVRNYAARNFMKDGMRKGDLVFWYQSNADPQAIVGVCEVVKEAYPDDTAFDPKDDYYDPKSDPKNPTWFMVNVKYKSAFKNPVTLKAIKAEPKLAQMALVRVGRLSVVPVTPVEWELIVKMGA